MLVSLLISPRVISWKLSRWYSFRQAATISWGRCSQMLRGILAMVLASLKFI